jgi:endonuclease/exonuclease/phosphatase family metal-dependent hydrolase
VDVVGLQEVTHQPTANAKTQFLDVQQLTAPYGFVSPAYTPQSDACRWRAENPHPCTHTTGLLFNRRTVRQVDTPNGTPSAGTLPASAVAAGLTGDSGARKVSWAYLSSIVGDGPFLAISLHTSTLKDRANEQSRVALGHELGRWAERMNAEHGMAGAPAVLMADLNSYRRRQPSGIQQVLVDEGWTDAAQAPTKRNVQYSTINYNPLLDVGEQGFPRSPYVFRTSTRHPELDATRIDYVMIWGWGFTVLDYEVVIRLRADGSFDPDYQGSDHQMVRATLDRASALAGG